MRRRHEGRGIRRVIMNHRSNEWKPASTFYLINASLPEVGDQPGSIPLRRRHRADGGPGVERSFGGNRRIRVLIPAGCSSSENLSTMLWPESHTWCCERGGTRCVLFGSPSIAVVTRDFERNEVVLGREMPSQWGSNVPEHADRNSHMLYVHDAQAKRTACPPTRKFANKRRAEPEHVPLRTVGDYRETDQILSCDDGRDRERLLRCPTRRASGA
ncbi:Hypothetical predicted protein [Olea europaea subsp. europaea]|uniref:Uncharacterized protein n=1 Tax=Olea europaea subsp. europaea TaxID=158383 RepID=A0A8S0SHM7_OLEEU|nr:Hypothetical predicted protein [Olea europaea subsp. europaea]